MHRFVVAVAFCTAFAASSAGEDLRAAIDVKGDGKYAYQIAKWTVEISKPGKEKVSHSATRCTSSSGSRTAAEKHASTCSTATDP